MLRLLSRWRYIWNKEVKAGESELNGLAAAKNARDFKARLERVTKEADDIEARIKEVAEMEDISHLYPTPPDTADLQR